jgi:calcium permeable stress-gated cation channel
MQTVHSSDPYRCNTCAAPEPRDIVWANMTFTPASYRLRTALVFCCMILLFSFWSVPITALAGLLSYKEIKRTIPWLGQLIDRNEKVRAIVQNSLPSVAMISLNALLPFLLEGLRQ